MTEPRVPDDDPETEPIGDDPDAVQAGADQGPSINEGDDDPDAPGEP